MQADQLKGMLDRAIGVMATMFLGWLVKRGWLGESDSATLLPALILLPSLAWGWWVNRDKALIQSAANVPGTVVISSPEMALDTPAQTNIISTKSASVEIAAAVAAAVSKEPEITKVQP